MHHTRSTGSGKEEAWSTQGKEEASLGQEVTLRVVPLFLLVLPFMGAEHTDAIAYLAKHLQHLSYWWPVVPKERDLGPKNIVWQLSPSL